MLNNVRSKPMNSKISLLLEKIYFSSFIFDIVLTLFLVKKELWEIYM